MSTFEPTFSLLFELNIPLPKLISNTYICFNISSAAIAGIFIKILQSFPNSYSYTFVFYILYFCKRGIARCYRCAVICAFPVSVCNIYKMQLIGKQNIGLNVYANMYVYEYTRVPLYISSLNFPITLSARSLYFICALNESECAFSSFL